MLGAICLLDLQTAVLPTTEHGNIVTVLDSAGGANGQLRPMAAQVEFDLEISIRGAPNRSLKGMMARPGSALFVEDPNGGDASYSDPAEYYCYEGEGYVYRRYSQTRSPLTFIALARIVADSFYLSHWFETGLQGELPAEGRRIRVDEPWRIRTFNSSSVDYVLIDSTGKALIERMVSVNGAIIREVRYKRLDYYEAAYPISDPYAHCPQFFRSTAEGVAISRIAAGEYVPEIALYHGGGSWHTLPFRRTSISVVFFLQGSYGLTNSNMSIDRLREMNCRKLLESVSIRMLKSCKWFHSVPLVVVASGPEAAILSGASEYERLPRTDTFYDIYSTANRCLGYRQAVGVLVVNREGKVLGAFEMSTSMFLMMTTAVGVLLSFPGCPTD